MGGRVRHVAEVVDDAARLACNSCKRQTTARAWRSYPEIAESEVLRVQHLMNEADRQNASAHKFLHDFKQYFHWVHAERTLRELEGILRREFPEAVMRRLALDEGTMDPMWLNIHGSTRPSGPHRPVELAHA